MLFTEEVCLARHRILNWNAEVMRRHRAILSQLEGESENLIYTPKNNVYCLSMAHQHRVTEISRNPRHFPGREHETVEFMFSCSDEVNV